MLKLSFTIVAIALVFTSFGQRVEPDQKIAEFGHDESTIDLYQNPNSKNVYLVFLNRQYAAIIDMKTLLLGSKEGYANFIIAMKSVDLNHKYTSDNYTISADKGIFGAMSLTIYNKDSSGYFYVSTKSIRYFEDALVKLQ